MTRKGWVMLHPYTHHTPSDLQSIANKFCGNVQMAEWLELLTFWSQSQGLKSLYRPNSAYDCMALYCTEPYIMSLWSSSNNSLTFTTLWAFSADDRLMIFFLFFPENRI